METMDYLNIYPIEFQALGARSAQSRQTNESKHGMAV